MERWINHDVHRIGGVATTPKIKSVRLLKPYPTMQRLHELFTLVHNELELRRPYHKSRINRVRGWVNPKCGQRYVRIDGKQCKIDKLIKIYKGKEE